ncbi:hypothetical protein D3C86_2124570 [compost metagenome]
MDLCNRITYKTLDQLELANFLSKLFPGPCVTHHFLQRCLTDGHTGPSYAVTAIEQGCINNKAKPFAYIAQNILCRHLYVCK